MNNFNNSFLGVILIVMILLYSMLGVGVNVKAEELDGNLVEGKRILSIGEEEFCSGTKEPKKILEDIQKSEEYFSKLDDNFKRNYWLGEYEFLVAQLAEVMGDKRGTARYFSKGEESVLAALQEDNNSSAANRLLADLYMRQTRYKGFLYTMTHGSKAMKLLKKSLKLDSQNYNALNSLASYYINAPKAGGGDVDKAIVTLERALASSKKIDNFISYIWLAEAYHKKENDDKAVENLKQALAIYPDSRWAPSAWTAEGLERLRD